MSQLTIRPGIIPSEHESLPERTVPANPFLALNPAIRAAIIGVYILYFIVAMALASRGGSEGIEWVQLALAVNLFVQLAPVIFCGRIYGVFHPLVFSAIFRVIALVRMLGMYGYGLEMHVALDGYSPAQLNSLVAFSLVLETIGLMAYYLGFRLITNLPIPRINWGRPTHLPIKTTIAVGVAVLILAMYLKTQGGLIRHMQSWGGSRHVALAGEGYWISACQLGAIATLLWFCVDRAAVRHPMLWVCAAVSLMLPFIASGSRGTPIAYLVIGLITWSLRERKIPIAKIIVIGVLAMILIGGLGQFRRSTWGGRAPTRASISEVNSDSVWDTATQAGDELIHRSTSANGTLPILARVPSEVPLLWGESYLAVLVAPIPRNLWEKKPKLIGGRNGEVFFKKRGAVPTGSVGEAYWNFHVPGVALAFFLFGGFHRWLARVLIFYADKPGVLVPYLLLLVLAVPNTSTLVEVVIRCTLLFGLMITLGLVELRRFR